MPSYGTDDVQTAQRIMRQGRFFEALGVLQNCHPSGDSVQRSHPVRHALLADLLQRIGQTDRAESMAVRSLQTSQQVPEISARCHLVLGNVNRERGEFAEETEHLQIAARLAESDLELSCWVQLRLMAAVADSNGVEAAMGRLEEVRRVLARFGDARPFAALHLWLAEMESTRGNLSNAQHHLNRAKSLLAHVEDVWLQGYLAINSSIVSYYCAEIIQSQRSAELALRCAEVSGHRATRRAAHATLGHIDLAQGNLSRALEYFGAALQGCEKRSVNQLAVLDSIAQVKLQSGDLEGCGAVLKEVAELSPPNEHSKSRYYWNWVLQTKIQLLLRQGNSEDAKHIIRELKPRTNEIPRSRVNTVTYLSAVETSIANDDVRDAVRMLCAVLSPTVQAPPDLFAEIERVTAKVIRSVGAEELARAHLERAMRTFDVIGHSVGRSAASTELANLPATSPAFGLVTGLRMSLDSVRALMDTRTRPELFAHEVVAWLRDLNCAETFTLEVTDESNPLNVMKHRSKTSSSAFLICLNLSRTVNKDIFLSFTPRRDPTSMITALEFQRVIEQIMAIDSTKSALADFDVIWPVNDWSSTDGVVFAAESMLGILRTVRRIAPTNISVLITGETGSGKEIIAKDIHQQSTRAAMPFVALNCAAVPKELLESQLFGYRRGAFSGASEPFHGVVRSANGGTLLLDEIGELPLDAQAKLLRFLETGEVHPIGEAYPTKVNVRILFATNANLEQALRENRFREDLFYRLNVITLRIPPLRERREEIPLLVNVFSQRFGREFSKQPAKFTPSAMELLILYSWPGNVRQLSNEVRRISALVDAGTHVTPDLLSPEIATGKREPSPAVGGSRHISITFDQTLEQAKAQLEREMVEYALKGANGHVTQAARTLGLSRKGLYLKRRRLGLIDPSLSQPF